MLINIKLRIIYSRQTDKNVKQIWRIICDILITLEHIVHAF